MEYVRKRLWGWKLAVAVFLGLASLKLLHMASDFTYEPSTFQFSIPGTKGWSEQAAKGGHDGKWEGYTIKPMAYVFPQFHAIPENDKFWGAGFTEWTNVKKVNENLYGLDTLRPTEEVGYYNLLDYDVRKRYADLVRDSGIYGIVYHHYWFGYPVMDKALLAMLEDGQPDVPFMLSWANEPWTARWDGRTTSDGMLLAQDYGNSTEWRKHFDWLAPFFRHPRYIRSNGGKVQFVVYAPRHIGDLGKRMYAMWRHWAAADPSIGGLEIIETLWGTDNPPERGPTDAISEFLPHSGGRFDMTAWQRNRRMGAVYHRGAMVSWNDMPRHATDGKADTTVWVHPALWKQSLIGLMRRIKLDPNPRGHDNFLFINALNEWAEGNVIEPSMQWGSRFSEALRAAKDYADASLPWVEELIVRGEALETTVADAASPVDVCVVVRDATGALPWTAVLQLQHTLWSLQAQHNPRWRAVVVPVGADPGGKRKRGVKTQVMDTYDPRIMALDVPDELRTDNSSAADAVTDWVVANLGKLAPACGAATYLLVTDASTTYAPHAFDGAASRAAAAADIVGLTFVSPATMALHNERQRPMAWDRRCVRYTENNAENTGLALCERMAPPSSDQPEAVLELSAAFVRLARWRSEGHSFLDGDGAGTLAALAGRAADPWTWVAAPATSAQDCDAVRAGTYLSCTRVAGMVWFDAPDAGNFREGCYTPVGLQATYWEREVPVHWDYRTFQEGDQPCVRLSEERYRAVMAGEMVWQRSEKWGGVVTLLLP